MGQRVALLLSKACPLAASRGDNLRGVGPTEAGGVARPLMALSLWTGTEWLNTKERAVNLGPRPGSGTLK